MTDCFPLLLQSYGKRAMQKEKRRNKAVKWIVLALLAAYATGMVVWAQGRARAQKCTGVEVEVTGECSDSLRNVTSRGVKEHLRLYRDFKGMRRDKINCRAIEIWLGALNNLESVECNVDARGRLVVRVEPLVPAMRVFTPWGQSYYVNRYGKKMDAKAEFFTDVPIVSGPFDAGMQPTVAMPVVRAINENPDMKDLVTMIEVKNADNIILVPRIAGHVINIGDTTDLQRKFRNLRAFYRKVMPYKGWHTYDTLSLKFRGQLVATLADKSLVRRDTLSDSEEQQEEEMALQGVNLEDELASRPRH